MSSYLLVLLLLLLGSLTAYQLEENSPRCTEVGLCVECEGFHQPWLAFPDPHSAYKCYTSCQAFTFKYVDTLDQSAGELCKEMHIPSVYTILLCPSIFNWTYNLHTYTYNHMRVL